MEKDGDTLILGGNIQLTGFQEFRGDEMVIVKKIVGNYAKKFSEQCQFERLEVDVRAGADAFEVSGTVMNNGTPVSSVSTDGNFFFVLDKVLRDIEDAL